MCVPSPCRTRIILETEHLPIDYYIRFHFSIVIQAIPKHATVSSIKFNNDLFCISSSICRVGEDGPWDQTQYINTQSNLTTHQVTGLLPFTVYSFRLIANNELGPSPPSKESYYIVTLREGEYPELII